MNEWDFSGDEACFFLFAGALTLVGIFRWYIPVLRFLPRIRPGSALLLLVAPPATMGSLLLVLITLADPNDVRNHCDYLFLFMLGGSAWLSMAALIAPWLGMDLRDDALERRNPAAGVTLAGILFALTATYAGGNIGAGPTIWTTIVPAAVASAILLLLACAIEARSGISDAIVIDRDVAAGVRHSAGLIAIAVILGRGAAGDWWDWSSTFRDMMIHAIPAAILAIVVIVLHRRCRPIVTRPRQTLLGAGIIPAAALIFVAVLYVCIAPKPEIGKHIVTYEQYMAQQ